MTIPQDLPTTLERDLQACVEALELRQGRPSHDIDYLTAANTLANFIRTHAATIAAQAAELDRLRGVEAVLVPRVPTESMVIDGFEAAFDCEQEQDEDTLGTCRGAAAIARATYRAMIDDAIGATGKGA